MFKGYSSTYFLLCAIALIAMFSTSLINPLLSIFAKEVGATGIYIGIVVAGYWISRILLEIPSGFISTRFGHFLPMSIGLLLTAVGTLFNAFASDPLQVTLARALQGLGAPLFFAVSMTLIVDLFDAKSRGSAMGLFQGIEFVGTIIGSAFSGLVVSTLNFRASFLFSAALAGVSFFMLVIPGKVRRQVRSGQASSNITLSSMRSVFVSGNLLIVSSATFAEFVMTNGVMMTVFPIYANEQLGFSLTDIGYLMGARSFGFVLAMMVMGPLADKIGRKPVILFGVASTGILIIAMNFATSFTSLAIVIFTLGATTGGIWMISPVLAAESVIPSQRGAAIGTYRTFFDLGSILGPIMMTAIQAAFGTSACFYAAAALMLANMIPTLKIRESR